MKKILASLCVVSLLGFSDTHAQQDIVNWKNDPTYSINNYKHPNKAAAAKQLQTNKAVQFITVKELSSGHTSKVTFPERKITVTQKTSDGKIKVSLAIRRRASEKQELENID